VQQRGPSCSSARGLVVYASGVALLGFRAVRPVDETERAGLRRRGGAFSLPSVGLRGSIPREDEREQP